MAILEENPCFAGHLGKSGNFQTAKAHGNVLNELSTIENIDIGIIWSEGGIQWTFWKKMDHYENLRAHGNA